MHRESLPRSLWRRMLRSPLFALLASLCAAGAAGQELGPLGPLGADGRVTYYIAPPAQGSAYREGDGELAAWALHAWERSARGALTFVPVDRAEDALVRIFWAPPGGGQYGEMMPLEIRGRRGAAVFVRPETNAFGPDIAARANADELFRDIGRTACQGMIDLYHHHRPIGVVNPEVFNRPGFQSKWERLTT